MATDVIQQFIDSLIAEAKLDGGEEERLQEYRERVSSVLNEYLGVEMVKWLDPKDTATLLDSIAEEQEPTPEELRAFLSEKVEHFEDKLAIALLAFRQDFLEDLQAIQ